MLSFSSSNSPLLSVLCIPYSVLVTYKLVKKPKNLKKLSEFSWWVGNSSRRLYPRLTRLGSQTILLISRARRFILILLNRQRRMVMLLLEMLMLM